MQEVIGLHIFIATPPPFAHISIHRPDRRSLAPPPIPEPDHTCAQFPCEPLEQTHMILFLFTHIDPLPVNAGPRFGPYVSERLALCAFEAWTKEEPTIDSDAVHLPGTGCFPRIAGRCVVSVGKPSVWLRNGNDGPAILREAELVAF